MTGAENRRAVIEPWRYLYRLPLLIIYLVIGLTVGLVCELPGVRRIPAGGMALGLRAHQCWSRGMLGAFGVRLEVHGALPAGPCLVVANHLSWLDIVLLHAVWPMRMVAKADIGRWPLVGWLARAVGTLFMARGDSASQRRTVRRMAALLRRGERIGIFPQGGIVTEPGIGRFHGRLFGAAIRASVPVVPAAIRYHRAGNAHHERVYPPGQTFLTNVLAMLGRPPCAGQVMIGRPLAPDAGRTELARTAQTIVTELYES